MSDATLKFEGPEKKLEIVLRMPHRGLRGRRDGRWRQVVAASRARIISRIATSQLDAYLLSESSLFVWDDRVLMITCGRTTLVQAVPDILDLVGQERVALVFYERKNLLYPQDQPADFEDDVAELDRHFSGKSYRLGPANHDHVHVYYAASGPVSAVPDATFQILMHDLDPALQKVFAAGNGNRSAQERISRRLAGIYPGMDVDHHHFTPYGYSLNAVSGSSYYTVHVSPQPEGSYASLESNLAAVDYHATVAQMREIFDPGRYSVVLTSRMLGDWRLPHHSLRIGCEGYRAVEHSQYEFDIGYAVSYLNFERRPGGKTG